MLKQVRQIVTGLGRIAAFGRAGIWQEAARFSLNPTQAEILSRIAQRPQRSVDLAAHLCVTAASLSDSVASLVAKGLAVRAPDATDRRARLVCATERGRDVAAQIPPAPATLMAAIGALPELDQGRLLKSLIHIVRDLQQAGAIPLQQMCLTCSHFRPHAHPGAARPHHCAFTDDPLGDAELRIDCGEHREAPPAEHARVWALFDRAG